jgi:hypothetical protein
MPSNPTGTWAASMPVRYSVFGMHGHVSRKHFRAGGWGAAALAVVIGAFAGCSQAAATGSGGVASAAGTQRTIVCDVGEILAGEVGSGSVRIENKSSHSWTIAKVMSGCSCTVVTPSRGVIPAGGSCTIGLTFHSADPPGLRSVASAIVFRESDVLPIRVILRARVHAAITCTPPELSLPFDKSAGRPVRRTILILNCGRSNANGITLSPSVPWIAAKVTKRTASELPSGAREGWLADFTAIAPSTVESFAPPSVAIIPARPAMPAATLPVAYQLPREPVRLLPDTLFFGKVKAGTEVIATLTIIAPLDIAKAQWDRARISQTIGRVLALRVKEARDRTAILEAKFRPSKSDLGYIGGKVTVLLPGDATSKSINVFAYVY